MIPAAELRKIASARWKDAEVLSSAGRYDSSVYLCGYCVELALKARICRTLKWSGFPSTNNEFQKYASFRTHDLRTLLHLSGAETKVKTKYRGVWSAVELWDPTQRYRSIGTTSRQDASEMLTAAQILMRAL